MYLIHTGQYASCKSPFHLCWQFFHNHDMLMLQMESPSLLNAQYSRVPTGSKTFDERKQFKHSKNLQYDPIMKIVSESCNILRYRREKTEMSGF